MNICVWRDGVSVEFECSRFWCNWLMVWELHANHRSCDFDFVLEFGMRWMRGKGVFRIIRLLIVIRGVCEMLKCYCAVYALSSKALVLHNLISILVNRLTNKVRQHFPAIFQELFLLRSFFIKALNWVNSRPHQTHLNAWRIPFRLMNRLGEYLWMKKGTAEKGRKNISRKGESKQHRLKSTVPKWVC